MFPKTDLCVAADEGFRAPYEVTMKGLADFIEDISTLLGEVGMSVSTAREETGSGRVWLALVSSVTAEQSASDNDRSTPMPKTLGSMRQITLD